MVTMGAMGLASSRDIGDAPRSSATREERDTILAAVMGQRVSSTGWVRMACPVCPKRKGSKDKRVSFGYRPKTGGFRCFRCGVAGRMQGEGYVLPEQADAEEPTPEVDLSERPRFHPLWTEDNWHAESLAPARQFLRNRGINRTHMHAAHMHAAIAGKYAGRVIVPHEDEHGVWWGFTSRMWSNPVTDEFGWTPPKVLYPPRMDRTRMYNEHVLRIVTDEPVMLVEGCLDAAWYLPHCIAALGKPTAAHFDTLCDAQRPVVICLDGDAWEEGRALSYRLRLRGVRASFVRLPAGEDPNSVNPTKLREQVAAAAHTTREPTCLNPSNRSP